MNTQIYDEASEWLVELQTEDTDPRMRERFSVWLDTSPEHVRAYLEVVSLWEDASGIDKRRALNVDELMASAKAERNLFPLDGVPARYLEGREASRGPWSKPHDENKRGRWMALAASIVVFGVGTAAAGYWNSKLRGVHSTDIGEQRTLALTDGTTVELNAGTRIRERFTETERAVELLKGQAMFRVAKNAARPFVVRSDTATVRAIGTQFDVHRRATGTTVTVLEGRVAVVPIAKASNTPSVTVRSESVERKLSGNGDAAQPLREEILLDAGEQVNLQAGKGTAEPQRADIPIATAWTQQRLAFEFAGLSDAAEEFNRFNARKLVVDSEGLEDFKVSGTFQALDPESLERFVRFLRAQPGLSVVESADRIVVSKNR